jgi:hypothetical protein
MARQTQPTAPTTPKAPPPPAPAGRQTGYTTAPQSGLSEEAIRQRAYQKWEAAGRPEGNDMKFWLEAERELRGGK